MNALMRLQTWYAAQCDDEWEHQYGIRIETLDNPGWLVKIDLIGTALVERPFPRSVYGVRDNGFTHGKRWWSCEIANHQWQAAGDETQLERLLTMFLDWTEQPDLKA